MSFSRSRTALAAGDGERRTADRRCTAGRDRAIGARPGHTAFKLAGADSSYVPYHGGVPSGVLRQAAVPLVIVLALGNSCGDESSSSAVVATSEDAVAAYVFVGKQSLDPGAWDQLLSCKSDPPCTSSGLLPGVASAATTRDHDRGWGVRILLFADASAADRSRLRSRTTAAGLGEPQWLAGDDWWPSCDGEPDCVRVKDSSSFG